MAEKALDLDEVVEHVLKFLPMKDLHRVARVSVQWNMIASRIKNSRHQKAWMLYPDGEHDGLETQWGQHFDHLASEPSLALVFCSAKSFKKGVRIPKCKRRCGQITVIDYLKQSLPPSCQVAGVLADGIVGTSFHQSKPVELESSKAVSCLLLPRMAGIDIYPFVLTSDVYSKQKSAEDEGNANRHGSQVSGPSVLLTDAEVDAITGIPDDKTVRLIVLLLTETGTNDDLFAKALIQRYKSRNVAVAGGYGYEILSSEAGVRNRKPSGLGIAFCGERVNVTSVVLQNNVDEPAQVKNCLQRLHNPVYPRPTNTSSICFMFACMGRGQAFYDGLENVESKAFSELYPGVPLFGFFGGGEIGYEFPQSWTTLPKFRHSYTSIFVMVSFT